MIISAATPAKHLTDSVGLRPGKTGQILQKITGGGFYTLDGSSPVGKLLDHVSHDSWVIITGHGTYGGGFTKVVGETLRLDDKNNTVKIEFSANDYVRLIRENSLLRNGDKINIMLFVCNGAKPGKDDEEISFAEQLANAFAEKGINTHILAVEGSSPRYERVPEDNRIEFKAEYLEPGERRVMAFDTDALTKSTTKYEPVSAIYVSQEGVIDPINPFYNNVYSTSSRDRQIIEKLYEELAFANYDTRLSTFLMNHEQAAHHLSTHPELGCVIHLSDQLNYSISYRYNDRISEKDFRTFDQLRHFLKEKRLIDSPIDESSDMLRRVGLFESSGSLLDSSEEIDLSKSGKRVRPDARNDVADKNVEDHKQVKKQ
jgi:hypothetical protein